MALRAQGPPFISYYACRNCSAYITPFQKCTRVFDRGGDLPEIETPTLSVFNCRFSALPPSEVTREVAEREQAAATLMHLTCDSPGCNAKLGTACIRATLPSGSDRFRYRAGCSYLQLNLLLLRVGDWWYSGRTLEVVFQGLPNQDPPKFYMCRNCTAHITLEHHIRQFHPQGVRGLFRSLTWHVYNCRVSATVVSRYNGELAEAMLLCSRCNNIIGSKIIRSVNPNRPAPEGIFTLFLCRLTYNDGSQILNPRTMSPIEE